MEHLGFYSQSIELSQKVHRGSFRILQTWGERELRRPNNAPDSGKMQVGMGYCRKFEVFTMKMPNNYACLILSSVYPNNIE